MLSKKLISHIKKKKKRIPISFFSANSRRIRNFNQKKKKKVIYETSRMKYSFFIILKRVGSVGSLLKSQNFYEQNNKVRR